MNEYSGSPPTPPPPLYSFAEVRHPGELHFFKDEDACKSGVSSSDGGNIPGPLKLSLMITLNLASGGGSRDDVEINLDFGDEKTTLRIKSLAEGEKWKKLLGEWKDYANLVASGKHRRLSEATDANDEETGDAPGGKARTISGELSALTFDDSIATTAGGGGGGAAPKKGLMGLFNKPRDNGANNAADKKLEAAAAAVGGAKSSKPAIIEGYLEKKHHIGSMHIGSEWQKVFCKIDEATTSLTFYKAANLSSPAGSIDLKMVSSILTYEKGTRKEDTSRFNIDMGDGKIYKFRSKGSAEGLEWTTRLEEWREHFLLN